MENNSAIVEIGLLQFATVYLLLVITGVIMKICKINQMKRLVVSSLRMTVQLVLTGYILTYIFENPSPIFTIAYILVMVVFAIHRVISKNKGLGAKFKLAIAVSITFSGVFLLIFFILAVVREDIFNPQYAIPIAGMVMGNTMTGVTLAVKTFSESLVGQRARIEALTSAGAKCSTILLPFVRKSLETAMLPTINNMVGMGIVALPGMMTGQILSGTLPTTAILYQIAIMITISTAVTLASFGSLYFGYKTLYDKKEQIINL